MIFTSYEFIIFIMILFVLYYIVPRRLQWLLLLLFSCFFYAMADVRFFLYIGTTVVSTYLITCRMDHLLQRSDAYYKEHQSEMDKGQRKTYKKKAKLVRFRWLVLCLVLNFGILAVIKYTNFTIHNLNALFHSVGVRKELNFMNLLLPLGISFYTFQTMGYAIDIYRGQYPPERNPLKLALFTSFFPQLIQGPISRFGDLSKTLYAKHDPNGEQIAFGLQRILWGYFKKLVIADRILVAVTTLIQDTDAYQGIFVVVGMLFYALELYSDFTGGIDITIGIAQVVGIRVQENFMRPYFSKSIKEYWNRWHISLGAWFKEYLFYPVSVCQPMLKLSKLARKRLGNELGKRIPVYISSILVWFITGFWHGASWNFIVWGLGNCFFILLSQELTPFYRWFHKKTKLENTLGFKIFRVIRTVLLMSSLRLFDCYRDVPLTFQMFGSIFTRLNLPSLWNGSLMELGLKRPDYIILLFGVLVLFTVSMVQRGGSVREKIQKKPFWVRGVVWYGLFLTVLLFGAYGIGYDASQFIYNQF